MEGHIKLYRKLLDHPVFAHEVPLKIWIWCLLKASFKSRSISVKCGKGYSIVCLKPGEFVFGRHTACEQLGISESTIYRWLQKFATKDWGLINIKVNNQYSIITICNWDSLQCGSE